MANLIIPRKAAYFEPHEGSVVKLTDDFPKYLEQPLVRVSKDGVEGLESGYRSGIITVDGDDYKIKGCRPNRKITNTGEPYGSQFLNTAQYEAERTQEVREIFLKEGYQYPLEPVGFWVYDDILVDGEPTAATIYKIKGDTRLDEFIWWLEKDLVVSHIPKEHRDAAVQTFEIFGAMVGRLIRIFHNHSYSWNCPDSRSSNTNPGNIVVFSEDGKINFGLVDLDNSWMYNPHNESKLMEETQKSDLYDFKYRMHYRDIISGCGSRSLKHISMMMLKYFAKKVADLKFEWYREDIDFNSFESEDKITFNTIRDNFIAALNAGYKEPGMYIPEVSLQEVREFKSYIQTVGNLYRNKVKENLSVKLSQIRMEDEERKGGHWNIIDDGYGFSAKSLIRVMFDDWIPRIIVYTDHKGYCLEGVSPEHGMIEPDKQGFNKLAVLSSGIIPMTADEIAFHLKEVSEVLRWWDSDMKAEDENNVFPTREKLTNIYRETFSYGIERSELSDDEKSNLKTLLESLK